MYSLDVMMKGDCNDSQEDPFQQENSTARFTQNSYASHLSNASRKSSEA